MALQKASGRDERFEKAPPKSRQANYVLRLYIAGNTLRSTQAVIGMRRLCEEYLGGRYQLEVIDVYQNPAATRQDQIIATPTLVRSEPQPVRKFIGDLSQPERLLAVLGISAPDTR